VGLLGLPNAGKSTLVAAVSAARPKIADYPFTTLHPILGVVRLGSTRSFVMADIPGLISGAAEGAGLGARFLRHLSRTRLLLHVVDVALINEQFNPAQAVLTVAGELEKFSPELADRERWLVCNKIDLLTPEEREDVRQGMIERLQWRGPTFLISAATGEGVGDLVNEVMVYLESRELESHTTG